MNNYCTVCGNLNEDDCRFCTQCGNKLTPAEPQQPTGQATTQQYYQPTYPVQPTPPKKKNSTIALVIILIVLILALIATAAAITVVVIKGKTGASDTQDAIAETTLATEETEAEETEAPTEPAPKKHTYKVITADVSWTDAKELAENIGGHLATINSIDEYEEIIDFAEHSGLKYIWLGARIYSESGSYDEWITGEPIPGFLNWYPGEPSRIDLDGTEEFYLCIWNAKYEGNDIGWTINDQRNNLVGVASVKSGQVGYIVEFE